ncbi:hypothetical protein [Vibrio porteresiae]|uniref:Uncharacterized protein n=1 Tax=Vibrio porteresiae DSM 19223 TaxID=1123496 RepID=A0ABZ0Q823_9VIBR|nr:hypothetical protein [Vibrio porteresiae]WPC72559.1 hypothetical protein R8Z52_10475 [Vibrio porteresiae DSM 19223]
MPYLGSILRSPLAKLDVAIALSYPAIIVIDLDKFERLAIAEVTCCTVNIATTFAHVTDVQLWDGQLDHVVAEHIIINLDHNDLPCVMGSMINQKRVNSKPPNWFTL